MDRKSPERKELPEPQKIPDEPVPREEENSRVIMLDSLNSTPEKSEQDAEKEEMQRAIVNINRKSRPLIKHVNVGKNDVLHISVEKEPVSRHQPKLESNNLDSWEDLLNEDNGCLEGDFHSEVMLYFFVFSLTHFAITDSIHCFWNMHIV